MAHSQKYQSDCTLSGDEEMAAQQPASNAATKKRKSHRSQKSKGVTSGADLVGAIQHQLAPLNPSPEKAKVTTSEPELTAQLQQPLNPSSENSKKKNTKKKKKKKSQKTKVPGSEPDLTSQIPEPLMATHPPVQDLVVDQDPKTSKTTMEPQATNQKTSNHEHGLSVLEEEELSRFLTRKRLRENALKLFDEAQAGINNQKKIPEEDKELSLFMARKRAKENTQKIYEEAQKRIQEAAAEVETLHQNITSPSAQISVQPVGLENDNAEIGDIFEPAISVSSHHLRSASSEKTMQRKSGTSTGMKTPPSQRQNIAAVADHNESSSSVEETITSASAQATLSFQKQIQSSPSKISKKRPHVEICQGPVPEYNYEPKPKSKTHMELTYDASDDLTSSSSSSESSSDGDPPPEKHVKYGKPRFSLSSSDDEVPAPKNRVQFSKAGASRPTHCSSSSSDSSSSFPSDNERLLQKKPRQTRVSPSTPLLGLSCLTPEKLQWLKKNVIRAQSQSSETSASDSEEEYTTEEGPPRKLTRSSASRPVSTPRSPQSKQQPKPATHPNQPGFPPLSELPASLPEHIKAIYHRERHGGQLTYKELHLITHHLASLRITLQAATKSYLRSGSCTFRLRQILRKHRVKKTLTTGMRAYRVKQLKFWREKALKKWKKLGGLRAVIRVLERTVEVEWGREGLLWSKSGKGAGKK